MNKYIKKAKVSFRGWAGHFICANQCRFKLNTLVEYGDIRIVISTVGAMVDITGDKKFMEIGCNRHYETMAFHASKNGEFWDADTSRQVYFDSDWAWSDINDEWKANKGHLKVIHEIVTKLEAGELFEVITDEDDD